jgi:hypothetical protein
MHRMRAGLSLISNRASMLVGLDDVMHHRDSRGNSVVSPAALMHAKRSYFFLKYKRVAMIIVPCIAVACALLFAYFTKGGRISVPVGPSTLSPQAIPTQKKRLASEIVNRSYPGSVAGMPIEQYEALKDTSARVISAYTAGSLSEVLETLTTIRGEVPAAWNSEVDLEEAGSKLDWFYSSIEVVHGHVEVIPIVRSGQVVGARNDRQSAKNGINVMRGVHDAGLSVLDELNGQKPLDEYEVIVPISYMTQSGAQYTERLGVQLRWSLLQRKWVQVGVSRYGFQDGQTLPMIPY